MRATALKNLRKKGIEGRAVLRTANVKDLPYVDDRFDVVFASFVIDLLEKDDRDRALSEFRRGSGRVVGLCWEHDQAGPGDIASGPVPVRMDVRQVAEGFGLQPLLPADLRGGRGRGGRISHRQVSPLVDYGVPFSDRDPVGHQMHGLLNIVNQCWLWIGVYALDFRLVLRGVRQSAGESCALAGRGPSTCGLQRGDQHDGVCRAGPDRRDHTAADGVADAGVACAGGGIDCRFVAVQVAVRRQIGVLPGGPYPGLGNRGLVTSGVYGRVRHPIYLAFILWQAGLAIVLDGAAAMLFAVAYALALLPLIVLEERDLLRYGAEYEVYRKRTPMLVPLWKAG